MDTQSEEVAKLLELVRTKKDVTVLAAPSFIAEFSKAEFFEKVRRIGFYRAVEVAEGAVIVNQQIEDMIRKNPTSRFITSPCPSIVRFIKVKYPELMSYLAPLDTPMSATAKLVLARYPQTTPVFVGPCPVKKLEAREQFLGLNILVLTFQEFSLVSTLCEKKNDDIDAFESFGKDVAKAREYPLSGGLSQSSRVRELLGEGIRIVDGPKNVDQALKDFKNDFSVRLLDILMCEGGCIGGKGYVTNRTLEERKKRVRAL